MKNVSVNLEAPAMTSEQKDDSYEIRYEPADDPYLRSLGFQKVIFPVRHRNHKKLNAIAESDLSPDAAQSTYPSK